MTRVNESMILPGGWHYKDPSGYRIPHTSELANPELVIKGILDYRLENRIPVGNPERDFEDYVCSNFPNWCLTSQATPAPNPNQPRDEVKFVDRIAAWANSLYDQAGRLSLVPMRDAQARSEICRRCPMNQNWENDCPRCVENARRLTIIIRQGRDVPNERGLMGCACHVFDVRTAIHLERAHLPATSEQAPEECWMRQ